MHMIYPGFILASVKFDTPDITTDQHQSNGAYGIHQARVRINDDGTAYRLIIAPADAPITVNGVDIDQHFNEDINPQDKEWAEAKAEADEWNNRRIYAR
tara:strand:+ start:358 stop:654 length:297 start_codon:yes stop_codon:yes gene_type:complete